MSEENLKACSIAYAKHKALNQLFENNSDCRADTWGESHDTIPPTMVEGEVIRAMTKDKFVEIITPLINTRQSADVEGAIELIDININSLALTEDRFPIIFGTECTKILTTIKNKLQGVSNEQD